MGSNNNVTHFGMFMQSELHMYFYTVYVTMIMHAYVRLYVCSHIWTWIIDRICENPVHFSNSLLLNIYNLLSQVYALAKF